MSELIRFTTKIEHTPITQKELEDRVILAVGYNRGEILPPYESEYVKRDAENVLEYLEGKDFLKSSAAVDNVLSELVPLPKVIEIVGGDLTWCMVTRAKYILEKESIVLINPTYAITDLPFLPGWKEGYLFNELATRTEEDTALTMFKDYMIFHPI